MVSVLKRIVASGLIIGFVVLTWMAIASAWVNVAKSPNREICFSFAKEGHKLSESVKQIALCHERKMKGVNSLCASSLSPNYDAGFLYRFFVPADTEHVWLRCYFKSNVQKQHVPRITEFIVDGRRVQTKLPFKLNAKSAFAECPVRLHPLDPQKYGIWLFVLIMSVGVLVLFYAIDCKTNGAIGRFVAGHWELMFVALIVMYWVNFRISEPFILAHDDNSALFSSFARSHLFKGLSMTFGQDFFTDRVTGEMQPYLHHPPFVALWLACWFKFTGIDSPAVVRMAMETLHLISFFLFCGLSVMAVRNRCGRFVAVSTFALLPMGVFCGRMANHHVPGLTFFLLGATASVWGCVNKERSAGFLWKIMLFAGWIGVAFSSWHALIAAISFSVCFWLIIRGTLTAKVFVKTAVFSMVVGVVIVVAQLIFARQHSGFCDNVSQVVSWISCNGNVIDETLKNLRSGFARGVDMYACLPWYLFWGVVLFDVWKLFTLRKLDGCEKLMLALACGNFLYGVIFSKALGPHLYHVFYFLPALSLSCGWLFSRMDDSWSNVAKWRKYFVGILFFSVTIYRTCYYLDYLYNESGGYARIRVPEIQNKYL